ncbi:MAG TPA: shikimate kinase [Anaerovoracaceae bacterium]|nr:shikimate kinase [Anaerovoracaceae bacterium]
MTIKLDITPEKLFIIGYIGSDRVSVGEKAAHLLGYELLVLDDLIVKKDGRPLKKIIMSMGEHEYRNKEYEILEEYSRKKNFVMVCGDGIILDDMCIAILKDNPTLFVDEPVDSLWLKARNDQTILYSFLSDPSEALVYKKFAELYQHRLPLYQICSTIKMEEI